MAQFKIRALVALSALALAGCGTSNAALPDQTQSFSGDLNAMTTTGLTQGFDQINQAVFNMIDVKHQGFIDQDEAGPYISLNDFDKIDKAHEGQINYQQFLAFATQGGFLEPNDSPQRFMERTRNYLNSAFNKLDVVPGSGGFLGLFPKPGDGYLSERQLSSKYVKGLGMGFSYPRLNIQVQIKAFKRTDFKAADHLGLGKLTIGEFEDLYITTVSELIAAIPTHGHHTHHNGPTPPASGSVGQDPGSDPGNGTPACNDPNGCGTTVPPAPAPSQNASSFASFSDGSGDLIIITTDDYNPADDINDDQ